MNPLEVLQREYNFLRDNRDDLLARAPTLAQKQQVLLAEQQAHLNLLNAINEVIESGDAQVQSLTQQLSNAQDEIEVAIANEASIAQILNLITSAIHLGSTLAGLV
jgi:translation initiation factor 2B subunit (eIF-2B alpha/beta/delta family)